MEKKQAIAATPYSNMHVHTPHSFSYFSSIEELAAKAGEEKIKVLGINDFDTWEGFREFSGACGKEGIFPSYGIEVMALSAEDQAGGRLANDPGNPGRVYLCGKGIPCPPDPGEYCRGLLERVKAESGARMREAVDRMNALLAELDISFSLSCEEIRAGTASGWVRERHIARNLAEKILGSGSPRRIASKLIGPDGGKLAGDFSLLQEELRSKLLKAGGRAYAEEKEGAFLLPEEAMKLFLSLGGIPVYPVLADGAGNLTDWEITPASLADRLVSMGYHAVEFIPHRNSPGVLRRYAETLRGRGFIVTAGSEHNSTKKLPLKPVTRDGREVTRALLEIFWEGCCAVIAHQERKASGGKGFVDEKGRRTDARIEDLSSAGSRIIAAAGPARPRRRYA